MPHPGAGDHFRWEVPPVRPMLALRTLAFALALGAATPAAALTEVYRLTGDATLQPEGAGSSAPISGSFELVRGPLCLLPPGEPPVCTEPPQWIPGAFDLSGGGFDVATGAIDPIALIQIFFRGQILLDPVSGLDLLPVVLSRELLVENSAGQTFREIRLAPVAGAPAVFDYDPAGPGFHPTALSLVYELQERTGTITFSQPPIVALPELTGETLVPLARIELAAEVPEPGLAVLLAMSALAAAARRR